MTLDDHDVRLEVMRRLVLSAETRERLRTMPREKLAVLLREHVLAEMPMDSAFADLIDACADRLAGEGGEPAEGQLVEGEAGRETCVGCDRPVAPQRVPREEGVRRPPPLTVLGWAQVTVALLDRHAETWEHTPGYGDPCDEDCRACEYEAVLRTGKAALMSAAPRGAQRGGDSA